MNEFARVKIINFLLIFRAVANVTVLAMLTTLCYVCAKKTTAAMIELHKVDQILLKLGQIEQLARANWRTRNSAIFLVLVVNIALNLTEGVLKALTKSDKQIVYFIVVTYPRIALSNFNTLFFLMTLILEERFRIINGLILKRKNESVGVGRYSKEANFCEVIDELVFIHKSLVRVSKEINQIFYANALFFVTADFILLVGDLYIIMYALFSGFFQKHVRTIISLVKNCTSYVTDLFYFAKRSSDLCHEANRTQVLLAGIHINIEKEEERNTFFFQVITSILKLIHNKLDITACRLFSINNALLFSVSWKREIFVLITKSVADLRCRFFIFKYSLSHLVFLHTNLVKITQKLNSCFGLHLFLWIALCVALIVVESHALLYMFLYTRSSINDFKFVIISIKNILLYSFDVCYLSKRCSNLCTEASHFKTILLSTKINIESEENRNSVRPTFFTSNIFPIDQTLLKLGQREQLARANWRTRNSAIFLVLVVNIALNLIEGVLKALTKMDKQIVYFIVVTYPRIALTNFNTSFFIMILMVEERFRIINGLILKRINGAGRYSKEANFCEAIDELVFIHKSLNCTSYVTDLFYFAKRSSDLCHEANRTRVLLAGIHINIEKEEERNTVITSILKLIHNKLDITACRLFSINNALLFSVSWKREIFVLIRY
ncbi:unnamed protein product [Tenebrio molitor]|nr:unnamed protein product [Tenebrio molitor]